MNTSFFKNTSWIIGGKIFQMILGLIVSVLSARYLGPTNYGLLSYAASFLAFFSAISTLSLGDVLVKELVLNPERQGELLGSGIVLRLVSSSLSILCILCMISFFNSGDPTLFYIAFLQSLSLFFSSFDLISYWYQSQLRSKVPTIVTGISYTIMTIYKIYILAAQKSIFWFAFSGTLEVILITIFLIIIFKRESAQKLVFSLTISKNLIKISYNFIISALMISIYGQMDKIMIGQMIDQTSVGYYAIATNLSTMWAFILSAIIQSAAPIIILAKKVSDYKYKKRLRQLYATIIWICLGVSLFVTIFASPIMNILYGSKFDSSINILKISIWSVVFSYLGVARGTWLMLENKQRYVKYLSFFGVISNIILNFILIPIFGVMGAVVATLTTQILVAIVIPLFMNELRENTLIIADAILLKDVLNIHMIKKMIKDFKKKIFK